MFTKDYLKGLLQVQVFSKKIATVLSGLEGVISMVDDIAVHGPDVKTHNERLHKVLQRLRDHNITLNLEKCLFGVESFSFLGNIVDGSGVRPDPDKVLAIKNFKAPTNVTETRRFLGMFNQIAKFIPNTAHETAPIRALLQKNN